MSCHKCKNTKCGCADQPFTIPANFSNDPTVCPEDSEQCTEVFKLECLCYDGMDIVELDIKQGDRLDSILHKLILAITAPGCANFGDDTACQSPINVTVTNLTQTTFSIEWDAVLAAVSYQVEIKEATSPTWLMNPAVTAPTVNDQIIGLTPDTVYDIRVHAICAATTCYSLNFRIKTLPLEV
jgi:hypothetical protein